jgi:hypothetical protein
MAGKCGIICRRYRQGKANGSLLIVARKAGNQEFMLSNKANAQFGIA